MAPITLRALSLLALAAVHTSAFKIIFYNGVHCNDFDGSVMDSLTSKSGCSTKYAGVAGSAIIEKEAGDGENDSVAFWSGACESSNLIAEGNTGCIQFMNYGSFNVISGEQEKKRDAPPAEHVTDPTDDLVHSDDPRWAAAILDDEKNNPDAITHGKEQFVYGGMHRWWQRAMGVYTAVPVEEWDDAIHVPDATHHSFGQRYPFNFDDDVASHQQEEENVPRNLVYEARSLEGKCQAFKRCAENVGKNVKDWSLEKVVPFVVNAYGTVSKKGKEIWNWIHDNPKTIVKFTANQGANLGVGVGAIYLQSAIANAYQTSAIQECSTGNSEASTIVSTITATVTETETVTSVSTQLYTPAYVTHQHVHYHLHKDQWSIAAQATSGTCETCVEGQCGAPTTKKRGLPLSRAFARMALPRPGATKVSREASRIVAL